MIISLPEYSAADAVLLFYPIGSEPDTLLIASDALAKGKTVAFPVTRGREMSFFSVSSLNGFIPGAMGIPEPDAKDALPLTAGKSSLCVVPALAVDKTGHRIGYGGGCYDRFLEEYAGFSVCIVFPQLEKEALPAEPHDVRVDAAAIPGRGLIRFK